MWVPDNLLLWTALQFGVLVWSNGEIDLVFKEKTTLATSGLLWTESGARERTPWLRRHFALHS